MHRSQSRPNHRRERDKHVRSLSQLIDVERTVVTRIVVQIYGCVGIGAYAVLSSARGVRLLKMFAVVPVGLVVGLFGGIFLSTHSTSVAGTISVSK